MLYKEIIRNFISKEKSLIIAPAGYGKTHTITECVKAIPDSDKVLILTHTHAGIASIKNKMINEKVDNKKFNIETITSYAQKYVKSYCTDTLPDIEDSAIYWDFILEKVIDVFNSSHIKKVIGSTYKHLFVDEYQDCNKKQHSMILKLSEILPTHILGDPLQGIIDFNDDLVNFEEDVIPIFGEPLELTTPYRWIKSGNSDLGDYIKDVRPLLEQNYKNNDSQNNINLSLAPRSAIEYINTSIDISDREFHQNSIYKRTLISKINHCEYNSLLLLVNKNMQPYERAKFINRLGCNHSVKMLEAIDDKDFYKIAIQIDKLIEQINMQQLTNIHKDIREKLLEKLFNKTKLNDWFNNSGVKNRTQQYKYLSIELKSLYDNFLAKPGVNSIYKLLYFLFKTLNLKTPRPSLAYAIISALSVPDNNLSAYKAIVLQRNKIRKLGRKVDEKCIGTTLLTKGLEFDAVIIVDAHKFRCPKNLYVAMTRATKKLIIFSKGNILKPYQD